MITRLKLKNWRSHHESEFKFAKGVNVLIGIMGSGKSSVMDALCYALFGTFPSLQQRKLKLDDILRDKPNQATSASVELDFVKDEAVYTVYREIALEKGTRNVELRKNGELLEAENSQAVTEYVEKILHLDYDIFSRAVYAEQNQLDYFLELPKGQRMAQIDSLLKIDRYEDARKTVTSLANKIDAERETKELDSKALFSSADESTIARLAAEISDTQKEAARLEAEHINVEKLLEQTRESLEKARLSRESKAEIERLESESRGLESTLEILDHELKLISKKLAENNTEGVEAEKEALGHLVEKFGTSKGLSIKLKK
ncbi:TPA: SMC family ATPase, partial [archaeon]|nr:SMC family ATPase [Candidatus Naiadarchaeales archaeon SRR2090153.bin461]